MWIMSRFAAALLLIGAASVTPGLAEDFKVGDLQIAHPWSRATPGGAKVAAGYLVITNTGTTADTLVGGTTTVAGKVEVHEMSMKDNVMTMRPVSGGLVIAPGQSVTLAPGGYHLMFFDLKSPLKEGGRLAATLEFAKAGKVDLTFDVQGIGASSPMPNDPGHKM